MTKKKTFSKFNSANASNGKRKRVKENDGSSKKKVNSEEENEDEFRDPFLDDDFSDDDELEQDDGLQEKDFYKKKNGLNDEDDNDDMDDDALNEDFENLNFIDEIVKERKDKSMSSDFEFNFGGASDDKKLQQQQGEEESDEELIDASNEESDKYKQFMQEAQEEDEEYNAPVDVYLPKPDRLIAENFTENLEYENDAYDMIHQLKTEYPVLSFDFIKDNKGEGDFRNSYPVDVYAAFGTQGVSKHRKEEHYVQVVKLSDLKQTRYDSDDEGSDDELDDVSKIEHVNIKVNGTVNRIKSMPQDSRYLACWTSKPNVQIYDIKPTLDRLDHIESKKPVNFSESKTANCLFTSDVHSQEGFALDWSHTKKGSLVVGSCDGTISVYDMTNSSWKNVDTKNTHSGWKGHGASVEDVQWSPQESTVFASCSCDRNIAIWDTRMKSMALYFEASAKSDVNVISWNSNYTNLIASGDDDGILRVWDLKMIGSSKEKRVVKKGTQFVPDATPVGQFDYHKHAITSIQWHPFDSSVLVATSEDHSCTVWDFSLEEDMETITQTKEQMEGLNRIVTDDVTETSLSDNKMLPSQLLFIHMGQQHMKEVKFHPQIPHLVGTAAFDKFSVWKSSNLVDPTTLSTSKIVHVQEQLQQNK